MKDNQELFGAVLTTLRLKKFFSLKECKNKKTSTKGSGLFIKQTYSSVIT